ncbi:universal stress protein [Natronobeatus ordinarius]|uniref:universal stress protein n=1 Tax=Natronobeatus ordinarius TaxID=2963433 RepID=UPI0020CD72E3|nr:universal stress protein [Natronobeatus ordinarius]
MYDRILVPTDGSEQAIAAIDDGIELAQLTGATIHALYVVEPIPLGRFPAGIEAAGSDWDDVVDEQKSEGKRAVETIAERAADAGVDVVEAIEHGKPSVKILEYVDDQDVDAIVMGTHGRTGAGRLMLGSVAEKVVRQSEVPVLTVRMTD